MTSDRFHPLRTHSLDLESIKQTTHSSVASSLVVQLATAKFPMNNAGKDSEIPLWKELRHALLHVAVWDISVQNAPSTTQTLSSFLLACAYERTSRIIYSNVGSNFVQNSYSGRRTVQLFI